MQKSITDLLNTVTCHELPNGLQVYHVNTHTNFTYFDVTMLCGAGHDPVGIPGLAHFLEHRISDEHPLGFDGIRDHFDSQGGSFMGGETSYDQTEYGCKFPSDQKNCEEALHIFGEMLFHSPLTGDLKNEKQIILREHAGKFSSRIPEVEKKKSSQAFWGKRHRMALAAPILGTKSSIKKISATDLRNFHSKHYHPANTIVIVVGGISEKVLLQTLGKTAFGTADEKKRSPDLKEVAVVPTGSRKFTYSSALKKKECDLVWSHSSKTNATSYIAMSIATSVISRLLFNELREKRGLCYSTGMSSTRTGRIYTRWELDVETIPTKELATARSIFQNCINISLEKPELWEKERKKFVKKLQMQDGNYFSILLNLKKSLEVSGTTRTFTELLGYYRAMSFDDYERNASSILSKSNRFDLVMPA